MLSAGSAPPQANCCARASGRMEARALALWPQVAQATNARDWPRVHPLLNALHEVMASADDLTPSTREALDAGIPDILDHLPASRSVFDFAAAAPDERDKPRETCAAASTPATVPVVGLMITKDDHAVLHEWLEANLRFLDGLVLLDGSEGSSSQEIVDRFRDASPRGLRLHYMHEASSPGLVQQHIPTPRARPSWQCHHQLLACTSGAGSLGSWLRYTLGTSSWSAQGQRQAAVPVADFAAFNTHPGASPREDRPDAAAGGAPAHPLRVRERRVGHALPSRRVFLPRPSDGCGGGAG